MSDVAPKQEPPYGLRMPPDLKARVKASAEANNRSMNAEIVAALEEKFPPPRSIVETVRAQVLLDLLAAPPEDREMRVKQANRALAVANSRGRFVIEGSTIRLVEE